MKGVLNGFGIFFSVIFSMVLFALMLTFVLLTNVKLLFQKGTITDVVKKIDFVDVMEQLDNEIDWDHFIKIDDNTYLTAEEAKDIINSEGVKNVVAPTIANLTEALTKGVNYEITKEEIVDFADVIIEEYNKVSEKPITDEQKQEFIDSITDADIKDFNESINIIGNMDDGVFTIVNEAASFGLGAGLIGVAIACIIVIILIALCRFSYYKWMPYVSITSFVTSAVLGLLNIGIVSINKIDPSVEKILTPFVDTIAGNMFISIMVLIAMGILLFVAHHFLKKNADAKNALKVEEATA